MNPASHIPGQAADLGALPVGFQGRIRAIRVDGPGGPLPGPELERRLLELGFTEGAPVEILHQGLFRDPIAVRVAGSTVALRRREARAVIVEPA
ncbi:FeoA family protein [Pararoseomonas indoligenes]|uniref:Ferrous iron transport protein A n=1 Tax=Roseomonas indoligenes TaxID=2820811 RepID=A0A940N431_9PROT|nr:FeoA family protein [Pararoseomonas indoligenes]MBP0494810.1 ferrous iron transport protein A [Pararoseomonas indoligenes]